MYAGDGKVALKALDDHLSKDTWIVGAQPSIADIDAYGVVAYATDGGFNLGDTPHIQAWMKRFEALPGYGKPEVAVPKESRKA
jgi:glutathione S-transferase